jgi:hypothetical protein
MIIICYDIIFDFDFDLLYSYNNIYSIYSIYSLYKINKIIK